MQIKKGDIIEGKITGITQYGAFVSVNSEVSGMVHISEIASDFIKDIKGVLEINQTVKAVVIGINDNGKLALSIKQMSENIVNHAGNGPCAVPANEPAKKSNCKNPEEYVKPDKGAGARRDFEDMMSKFKRDSDEKISDLKFLEPKKGAPSRKKMNQINQNQNQNQNQK